jgi:hypothetical protein
MTEAADGCTAGQNATYTTSHSGLSSKKSCQDSDFRTYQDMLNTALQNRNTALPPFRLERQRLHRKPL